MGIKASDNLLIIFPLSLLQLYEGVLSGKAQVAEIEQHKYEVPKKTTCHIFLRKEFNMEGSCGFLSRWGALVMYMCFLIWKDMRRYLLLS